MFFLVLKVILKSTVIYVHSMAKTVNHVGKPMDQFKLHGH